ncbi:MAG TPA: type II toxin-antitoxin system PemK/MazF family toxin [Desulfobacteraceae bacterium]|nr:type II toxin-antitoxin system PemK/MazF family toxin [Desulfobacteraceae bacterium]
MGRFVKGDLVVLPFPFSDLSKSKRRPALVLASLPGDDVILCQITSVDRDDPWAIPFTDADLKEGTLGRKSFIRPTRLFTADSNIVIYRIGRIKISLLKKVIKKLIAKSKA